MTELTVKTDIMNIDSLNTLVEILAERFNELPNDLQESLEKCLNSDTFNVDYNKLVSDGYIGPFECKTNGKEVEGSVISFNKHLKKVSVMGDGADMVINHIKLDNFIVTDSRNKIACEW